MENNDVNEYDPLLWPLLVWAGRNRGRNIPEEIMPSFHRAIDELQQHLQTMQAKLKEAGQPPIDLRGSIQTVGVDPNQTTGGMSFREWVQRIENEERVGILALMQRAEALERLVERLVFTQRTREPGAPLSKFDQDRYDELLEAVRKAREGQKGTGA